MKNPFLLSCLLLVLTCNAIAQDCDGVKEKKDPFTNKTEKSARVIIGNLKIKWSVDVNQSDGETSMKWAIAMQGEFNQKFDVGTKLLLKLEDGTVLNLKTSEPSSPVTQAVNGGAGTINVFTTYSLKFVLSKESLTQLARSPIVDLKFDIPGQEIKNPKIKNNQMGKLQSVFTCLLNS